MPWRTKSPWATRGTAHAVEVRAGLHHTVHAHFILVPCSRVHTGRDYTPVVPRGCHRTSMGTGPTGDAQRGFTSTWRAERCPGQGGQHAEEAELVNSSEVTYRNQQNSFHCKSALSRGWSELPQRAAARQTNTAHAEGYIPPGELISKI